MTWKLMVEKGDCLAEENLLSAGNCLAGERKVIGTVGNTSTVIYDHPITAHFPHQGWCDLQFYPLFKNVDMACRDFGVISYAKGIRFENVVVDVSEGHDRKNDEYDCE